MCVRARAHVLYIHVCVVAFICVFGDQRLLRVSFSSHFTLLLGTPSLTDPGAPHFGQAGCPENLLPDSINPVLRLPGLCCHTQCSCGSWQFEPGFCVCITSALPIKSLLHPLRSFLIMADYLKINSFCSQDLEFRRRHKQNIEVQHEIITLIKELWNPVGKGIVYPCMCG